MTLCPVFSSPGHVFIRRGLLAGLAEPLVPLGRQLVGIVLSSCQLHPSALFHAILMLLHLAAYMTRCDRSMTA